MREAPRIAICHQSVFSRDAVGNDVVRMYELFETLGYAPDILCEYTSLDRSRYRIHTDIQPRLAEAYDLCVYHHSIHWERGGELVKAATGQVAFKYHNITPPEFFERYAPPLAESCRRGREQTRELIQARGREAAWICDSRFNQSEIDEASGRTARTAVAAPFRLPSPIRERTRAGKPRREKLLLSVGRLVPNKGHLHALRILAELRRSTDLPVRLLFVGKIDPSLAGYLEDVEREAKRLRVTDWVGFEVDAEQERLETLFATADAYLCTSLHEGFCVPIIEAQSVGLPVVSFDSGALKDTAGPNQLVGPVPASDDDYLLYAALLQEVLTRPKLRQKLVREGMRNVLRRFTPSTMEDALLDCLWPTLERLA